MRFHSGLSYTSLQLVWTLCKAEKMYLAKIWPHVSVWVRADCERPRKWNRMSLSDNLKAVLDICRDLDGGYAWDSLIWAALKCTSIQPHNGEPPQFVSSIPWLFWKEWWNFSCSSVQGGLQEWNNVAAFSLYYLHELILGIYWGCKYLNLLEKCGLFFI